MSDMTKQELPELITAWLRFRQQAEHDAECAQQAATRARRSTDQRDTLHSALRARMRELGVDACSHENHVYTLVNGAVRISRAPDARFLEHQDELALNTEQSA